jgi:PAS domain S-box-containing protein
MYIMLPVGSRSMTARLSVLQAYRERPMTEADESRYRLRAVLETAVDGIITIDERGIIQSANPAVGRLFGYGPAELGGRNVSILMPPLHAEQHDKYLAHYMRTGEARVIGIGRELQAVRRDGSVFPIELAVSEVPGDGARYFTGIIRDISARKRTEQDLLESQARIQAVLTTAVDAILTIDQRGVIENANPSAGRLFGYDPAELVGRNISMLMPAEHASAHDGYLARYLRTGEARIVGLGREVEGLRRDGTTFPAELAVSEVRFGDQLRFTGIVRDITVRKKAEQDLLESQARIQAVLTTAVDAILTIDECGVIESANPSAGRLFGYEPAELVGRNISMLMPAEHASAHDGYLARYLRTGEARIVGLGREVEGLRRDGSTFPADLAVSEVRFGDQLRFTGIIRDITVRKKAEEALLRADAMKDEFLANTSHELRTPLNGIIGIGQSMLDGATGPLSEEQQRNLAMIVASGRRLANLVNDILDFSKLRHETVELHRRPTDLYALTELVLAISRTLVGKRALRLFNRIDAQVPLVEVDEDRAQQILFNLIGNAVKFTQAGAVDVFAKVRNQWLDLTVSDTGPGIGADRLETIFDSFSQGDGSAARQQGGTGLGLAISKQLAELHGGNISVASEVGVGSHFTLSLPLSLTTRAMLTPDSRPDVPLSPILPDVGTSRRRAVAGAQLSSGAGLRVLVVDDEQVNVQALVNFLTLAKYEVVTAADGQEALDYLAAGSPCDIVLLDVMMPKLSGFDVCQRIREHFSPAELPVILLTAKNRVSDLVMGFGAGASDYLTKPFASDELLARVSVHLELAKISDSYARFVPRQFLEQLGKDRIVDVALGDQVQRDMTVLFSDIRNFTRMSEGMTPAQTFSFVNQYLGAMEPAISGHSGVIDKFVGDAVMALFPRRADDAVQGALDMIRRLQAWNAQRAERSEPAVKIGIGLHTGSLMLGTVGARDRMDTTVISDAVNLASRVESLTKIYRVPLIITEATFLALQNPTDVSVRRIDRVLVQGKSQPVVLYEVLDAHDPPARQAKQLALADFEHGESLYEAHDFLGAIGHLERALARDPADTVVEVLLERARRFAGAAQA